MKGDYNEATIVKCKNDADMCHGCFLEICENGYKPLWVKIVKNDEGREPNWLPTEERDTQRRATLQLGSLGSNQTLTTGTTT